MVARNTQKATPEYVSNVAVDPAAAVLQICNYAKSTRDAALLLTCSVTAYMINVCYLRDTKDPLYAGQEKAIEEVKRQVAATAQVKGGMLDIYINTGRALYGRMILSGGKHAAGVSDVVNNLSALKAGDAEKAVTLVRDWLEAHHKIKSLNELRVKLGYSIGSAKTAGGNPLSKENFAERLGNSIDNVVEKLVQEREVTPTQVAEVVALHAPDPVAVAKAAVRRVGDIDALYAIIKAVEAHIDQLTAAAEKDAKPKGKPAPKAKKGKTATLAAS